MGGGPEGKLPRHETKVDVTDESPNDKLLAERGRRAEIAKEQRSRDA
jgi:hypothetical protein